eukprot:1088603-Prymnesium_polylepis.1
MACTHPNMACTHPNMGDVATPAVPISARRPAFPNAHSLCERAPCARAHLTRAVSHMGAPAVPFSARRPALGQLAVRRLAAPRLHPPPQARPRPQSTRRTPAATSVGAPEHAA